MNMKSTRDLINTLNKIKYFEKDFIMHEGVRITKPTAIVFDWENTLCRRIHPYLLFKDELHFQLTSKYVIPLLELLRKNKIYTAIVSNKDKLHLNYEIQKLNLSHFFDQVIGSGDLPVNKPSIDCMIKAIDDTNIKFGENIWVIGDSEVDMQFAKISCSTGVLFDPSDLFHKQCGKIHSKFFLRIVDFDQLSKIIKKFYEKDPPSTIIDLAEDSQAPEDDSQEDTSL